MKLFLDDVRMPMECSMYMHKRIGKLNPIYLEDWEIVRNYNEFRAVVTFNANIITHVSFDHDLADIHYGYNSETGAWAEEFKYLEETGYDCAMWLKEYYKDMQLPLPIIFIHSMNPVGVERIKNVFKN